eukprot:gene5077-3663_t
MRISLPPSRWVYYLPEAFFQLLTLRGLPLRDHTHAQERTTGTTTSNANTFTLRLNYWKKRPCGRAGIYYLY